FTAIVTSAATGAAKPDPRRFLAALGRLGVARERALHVGDPPDDEEGARAAGMRFAPVPLSTVVDRIR
ncbi:MAG: HAD-IA family hydrolase, partial [Gaiellaceae bacterium]